MDVYSWYEISTAKVNSRDSVLAFHLSEELKNANTVEFCNSFKTDSLLKGTLEVTLIILK